MSNLVYIMGKSATGKDTIYKRIKEKIDINEYILYTTRPIRTGEQEGVDYHYVSNEQMQRFALEGKVIESRTYQTVNGPWTYATIADDQWEKEGNFLSVGTLESYTSIVEYLKNHPEKNLNMMPVYISIDEQEREKRARKREELQAKPNYKEMERRFKTDNIDFSEENLRKAGIGENQTFENYDLDECVESIVKYIQREREKELSLQGKYKVEGLKPVTLKSKTEKIETEERGISD